MSVIYNEAAIQRLLGSPSGPVGRELNRRAEAIRTIADGNIHGPWLNVDTGDLVRNLKVTEVMTPEGVAYTVGSNAEHRGFRYGGFWDENGRPWLSEATADVFPG